LGIGFSLVDLAAAVLLAVAGFFSGFVCFADGFFATGFLFVIFLCS
jgi:hypothetical protein